MIAVRSGNTRIVDILLTRGGSKVVDIQEKVSYEAEMHVILVLLADLFIISIYLINFL